MPDRTFRGFRQPPSMADRLTTHMAEVGIAVLGILRGLHGLIGDRLVFVSPAVDSLPKAISYPVAMFLILGGSLWIYSTASTFVTINSYWHKLRWGLTLCGFGWLGYFVAAIALRPTASNSWTTALIFCMISWSLYVLSFFQEREVRRRGCVESG